jgi:hypothetical protein
MEVKDLLDRARSVVGAKTKYKLGAGGISPALPSPANVHNECDCSGYVCWCLGISRQTTHPLYVQFNGGWINTDAIVHDAIAQTGFFAKLEKALAGCLIVYPGPPKRKVGHVGIVTLVGADDRASQVIHCSAGNFRAHGDAIQETAPTVFNQPDAILVWYQGLVRP